METAMLLIDIQNDYFAGGRNPLVNAEQAAGQAARALTFFRSKNLPILHVQHISLQDGATFFLPDTDGCQIYNGVFPEQGESVIVKHTPDSFFQTDLHGRFTAQNIKRLYICGMMSHMCIDTSVRAAKRLGYSVCVLEDACATKDLIWNNETIPAGIVHNTFMASLNVTFATVIKTSQLEIYL
ncbi:MAG: cysteine hydrolase [Clostridiales bacterium]|jgi:nicotinamidase-related amidase|nr:cysteine hydrolase [Clostridiales bacterium]